MEKAIKINTRENGELELKRLRNVKGKESKTYLLRSSLPVLICGHTEKDKKYLNLGGVSLIEGDSFNDHIIKSIEYISSFGYIITFI